MTRKNNRRKPFTWSVYETIVHSSVYEEWDTQVTHYAEIVRGDIAPIMHVYDGDILQYRVMRIECAKFDHPSDAHALLGKIAQTNNKEVLNEKVIFA